MPDGRLEFDQGMSPIVTQSRNRFAVGTEVGIVADGTLVAGAPDVLLVRLPGAECAITVNSIVHLFEGADVSNLFEQGCKPMARMDLMRAENASRAVVPIRTAQTFVADAEDVLQDQSAKSPTDTADD